MRKFLILVLLMVLSSCVATPPGPEIFEPAERAIENAERAGAEELSPVELKFAREMLDLAHALAERGKLAETRMAIERSEINSELAIEQSRTALERRKVNEMMRANEMLAEELQSTYGEAFE